MDYEQIMQEARNQRVQETGQLTLGQLIRKLRTAGDNKEVVFDFGGFYPVGFISWRGIYRELALTYADHNNNGPMRIGDFLSLCEETVGQEFYGYKGGEFVMDHNTPIWVDNYGESNQTALVDVIDNDYQVVLITRYCEPYN